MLHSNTTLNHKIENFTYANAGARTGATGLVTADIGKVAYQSDDMSYWRLTATAPTWVQIGGGGMVTPAPQFAVDLSYGNDIGTSTVENVFVSKKVPANALAIPGLAGIRFRAWGHLTNNTTATLFTPRIRWNTAANLTGSPITLLTPPTIQGTTTAQATKPWDLDMMFVPNLPIAFVTAVLINHTEDSGGVAKTNCGNNGASGVNLVTTNVDRYIMLSWQMDQSSSGIRVATYAATMEFLYSL